MAASQFRQSVWSLDAQHVKALCAIHQTLKHAGVRTLRIYGQLRVMNIDLPELQESQEDQCLQGCDPRRSWMKMRLF
jgi:hypothetical protein